MRYSSLRVKALEWARSIAFAVTAASLVRWGVIEAYTIPSSSMEQTALTGDFILVSKLHYGARTPRTPLQVPLTHQTLGSTNIRSYSDLVRLPSYRLPGFSHVKRGDQVVFNYPVELDKPVDLRTYYIKRCVGLPGDTIVLENGALFVNQTLQPTYPGLQHRYYAAAKPGLDGMFFETHNVREFAPVSGGYLLHASAAAAASLRRLPNVYDVRRITASKGVLDLNMYPRSISLPWNADYFGPLRIPRAGMQISIDSVSLAQYQHLIVYHEGHKDVRVEGDALWIDNNKVLTYTFLKDYYFVLGDNRHNSVDSRFWGCVPADHLVGKAVLTLFSWDRRKPFWQRLRWRRIFKPVQ